MDVIHQQDGRNQVIEVLLRKMKKTKKLDLFVFQLEIRRKDIVRLQTKNKHIILAMTEHQVEHPAGTDVMLMMQYRIEHLAGIEMIHHQREIRLLEHHL